MPGGFPVGIDVVNAQDVGTTAASTTGTTITASGSTNTKGSWSVLTASLGADCVFATFEILGTVGSTRHSLLDIGIGATGSEKVIISNIFVDSAVTVITRFSIPISIPAGTQIQARCQSATASNTTVIRMTTYDGSFTHLEGSAGADGLGVSTSTSTGTTVTAGAANAKGSYAVLISSTTRDYSGLVILYHGANGSLTDIAIGATGSEKIIIPNQLDNGAAELTAHYVPILIPSGTQIQARTQTVAGAQTISLGLLGVYL